MASDAGVTNVPDLRSRIHGCLLGGAVGDALGAPVEFLTWAEIQAQFGPSGITDYAPAYGRRGAITDDTQMTLFTAEGLIRAINRGRVKGICDGPGVIWHAYLRWLHTQGSRAPNSLPPRFPDGWLVSVRELHSLRAPGSTCLSALASGRRGTRTEPINDSKGCGGIMRVAPIGFFGSPSSFETGCDTAASTHGHPSGYLSAGFLACMISEITQGQDLDGAADAAGSRARGSSRRSRSSAWDTASPEKRRSRLPSRRAWPEGASPRPCRWP